MHLEMVLIFLNVAWSHLVPSSFYVLIVIYYLLYKLFKSQTDAGGKRGSPDLKRTESLSPAFKGLGAGTPTKGA